MGRWNKKALKEYEELISPTIQKMIQDDSGVKFEDVIDELNDKGLLKFSGIKLPAEAVEALKKDEDLQESFNAIPKTGWESFKDSTSKYAKAFGVFVYNLAVKVTAIAVFIGLSKVSGPLPAFLAAAPIFKHELKVATQKDFSEILHNTAVKKLTEAEQLKVIAAETTKDAKSWLGRITPGFLKRSRSGGQKR